MNYPLLSDYIEAIKAAEDNFEQLKNLRPVLEDDGSPVMTSGNFAVVFKMKDEQTGKLHAVKCFLREQEGRAEAYRQIAEELEYVSSTFLTPIKYLDKELFVDTNASDDTEFPVLLMDWVEGETLDKYIRKHLDDQYELSLLAYQFSRLAMWLMPQPFAHGDLKPDNILVKEDGTLVLVDYDGMYVPAMKGQKARELGSPDFRHPSRTESDFDEHIDDFSLASILLSLKAIALQPSLLEEYGASDRLLFSEKDYRNLSESSALGALQPLMQDAELASLYSLYILALSQNNLSQVSFRLFNLSRPQVPIPEDIHDYWWYIERTGVWTDEYGVKYSADKKFLISAPNKIKEYAVPKGTKYIASNAFVNCIELCSISLPNTLEVISNIAFLYCVKLSSITIPKSVKEVGLGAFEGCFSLTTIVVDKGNLFYDSRNNCNAIIETLSNTLIVGCSTTVIPPSTTKIGESAFSHCNKLKSIKIPDSILEIDDYAFSECYYLEKIIIPQSVISIGCGIFQNCQNLSSLIVENENIQYDSRNNCNAIIESQSDTLVMGTPVTSIPNSIVKIGKNSFRRCQGLDTITIPNGIIEIDDGAFESCQYLSEIKIPDSVIKIGKGVFSDCRKLKTVIIPYGKRSKFEQLLPEYKDKLVEQDEAENLSTVVTEEDLTNAWTDEYGVKYSIDRKRLLRVNETLTSYSIKEGTKVICDESFSYNFGNRYIKNINIPNTVVRIGYAAFRDCVFLTNINVPDSVEVIGERAFSGCESLSEIFLPNSVTQLGDSAFYGCESLLSMNIPNSLSVIGEFVFSRCAFSHINIPKTINKIGAYAFEYCDNLEEVIIPDTVTNLESGAFASCSSLKHVTIPDSITELGYDVFSGSALTHIEIPKSITKIGSRAFENSSLTQLNIPHSVKIIEEGAFYGSCLEKIVLPDSITEIADSAFFDCFALKQISIPNSVTRIGDYAFQGCDCLSQIELPDSIKFIGSEAFVFSNSLTQITVPASVVELGDNVFSNCHSLKYISFLGVVNEIGDDIFYMCDELDKILIPIGTQNKYEELLPNYKDKLVEQSWSVKNIRSFSPEEIALIERAEVVNTQYGRSVCFHMKRGDDVLIPLSNMSTLNPGDMVDVTKAKYLTLHRDGDEDINRVID